MPKLPTYDAPLGPIADPSGRRATADDFGGQIGVAFGRVGAAVKQVRDDIRDSELRTALVRTSQIRAKYARKLDEAANSGADLEAIRQEMNDELSKAGDDFGTREAKEQLDIYVANSNVVFDQQANSIAVRRAGIEAKLQASLFLSSADELIQKDPSYLSVAEKNAEVFAATMTRIPVEDRKAITQMLREQLNMSAAMRSASLFPQETKTKLEGGAWTLTPEQRRTAISHAESAIRAKRVDETYAREQQDYEKRERNEEARRLHYTGIINGDDEYGKAYQIIADKNLNAATIEHLIDVIDRRAKELKDGAAKSNPLVKRNLWLRINAPVGDPTRLYVGDPVLEAVARGALNTDDGNELLTMIAEQRDQNNQALGSRLSSLVNDVGNALALDPKFTLQSSLVAEIQMDYASRVNDKIAELRRNKKDPNLVFDATSSEFVGAPAYIAQSVNAVQSRRGNVPALTEVIDLRTTPDGWKILKPGDIFIDPKGNSRTATQELLDALEKGSAPAPKPSTNTVPPAAPYDPRTPLAPYR